MRRKDFGQLFLGVSDVTPDKLCLWVDKAFLPRDEVVQNDNLAPPMVYEVVD